MGSANSNSPSILPQISKKLAIRTFCLVVVVGSLLYGLLWFLKYRSDLDMLVSSDTAGWVAAVEYLPEGHQAVLISPDGVIHRDLGYKSHSTDRDLAWSPKGNFLYFISDRSEHNFNLYRWSPKLEKPAEQRTTGTRARSNPTFSVQPTDERDGEAKSLITCGGLVQQFDPANTSTEQVLPPTTKEITQTQGDENEKGGIDSQFQGVYGRLGTSFRVAQWCGNKRYIAGIMRRENGEVLILQDMQPESGKLPQPKAIASAEHIDLAVNPKDGNVVYTIQNFQWPDVPPTDPSGNPTPKPFMNAVAIYDLEKGQSTLITKSDKVAFGSPAIKPDGSSLVLVIGKIENGGLTPTMVANFPTTRDPGFKQFKVPGDVHEPSWSPDGNHLLLAIRDTRGKRTIYDLRIDDGTMRAVTGDGDFGFPVFSPQVKSSG